jgi:hypothetical protein
MKDLEGQYLGHLTGLVGYSGQLFKVKSHLLLTFLKS